MKKRILTAASTLCLMVLAAQPALAGTTYMG